MVKFYSQSETYAYPFPAVTLAYFLRYPNPYSTHVISTDTIARSYDPETQRLTTVRLHLKRSKLPAAVLKLVPRSLLGASASGDTQTFILERSVVDMKEGVMDAESRNLEWTGVLSVVERQVFKRPVPMVPDEEKVWKGMEGAARRHGFLNFGSGAKVEDSGDTTDVTSSVTLHSHIGEAWKRKREAAREDAAKESSAEEEPPKMGFFRTWGTAALQRNIEKIGLTRAQRSQPNAREGMKVVLERMREGGLVAVLEGMRQDRETILAGNSFNIGRRGDDE
ncbi:MSF1-domain-containing protein [Dothidotthia symphoricarpi CBS 119687]|uniref:MSF1-domain-containing protein n=1 Tax=Dothidotthia symphoricarpi CBS 119687 TaxID=1392245 RepID=A0A6A6ARV1_9PLEO|nr:MSF1-domain-containing protein [Dothidotthia symphoricarpi CBS 119687]KAF2133674.1 MSF1-domain-containing protein [Dothidotthia symphoricarpi CBS 119687]